MTVVTTRLWWVRHASVAHGGRVYGQTDLSCDCSDIGLFVGLAEQLPRAAVRVMSTLRRTHETAAAIVRAGLPGPAPIPGPRATALAGLAEQNFGDWDGQGLTYDELRQSPTGDFHRFWHARAHEAPPGGESFVAVIERVSRTIQWLVAEHAGQDIIAVAHGGTIRSALALALDLKPEAALFFRDKPEGRCLEFDVFSGAGWAKLCPFLGQPVPSQPFPQPLD